MVSQLSLGVNLQDTARFDNFLVGHNAALLAQLEQLVEAKSFQFIYLYGRADAGKTHLLRACEYAAQQRSRPQLYCSLAEQQRHAAFLDQLAQVNQGLVCLDDVHQVLGDPVWEESLFHLFNRLREQGGQLLISADVAPAYLPVKLADLASRLAWGLTYQVQPLEDQAQFDALVLRARQRGLALPDEVARYLLTRSPRRLSGLFALLDVLDEASLKEQRKLTIPFVRSALGWAHHREDD
ncbi:DnaA regulatory inactivator Hda [Marinospirillum sp. MEB164]|uniref:DnaA regulatory inactivator Hda n=1 Tax=Marinospirillum alkalitolerans TaxID=3123374 RepID=A0ABW8PX40_9GAMM